MTAAIFALGMLIEHITERGLPDGYFIACLLGIATDAAWLLL